MLSRAEEVRMKKRKRKMSGAREPGNHQPYSLIITASLLALVMAIARSGSAANVIVPKGVESTATPASTTRYDNLLNRTLSEESSVSGINSSFANQTLKISNHPAALDNEEEEEERMGLEIASENSSLLGDLLAVESTRLLTIGKRPAVGPQQHSSAPYASDQLGSQITTNQSSAINQSQLMLNDSSSSTMNQSPHYPTITQIYRPPPPVFVRHPPTRQELRLLYPTAAAGVTLKLPSSQPSGPGWLSTDRPSTSSASFAWPPPHQQPIFFLPPRAGRPIIASTTAPSSWPSWYSMAQLNKSLSSSSQSAQGQPEHNTSAVELEQRTVNINRTTIPHNNKFLLPLFNNTTFAGSKPTTNYSEVEVDGGTLDTRKFANSNSSSVSTYPSVEREFEQSQLSAGHYQRTNAANMSWSQLLRQATEGNVMESLMVTNRTMVSLLCNTDDMLVRLKFKQPFHGSVATNLDRRNSCRLQGNGAQYYELRISLQECGTRQESPRLFINNIQIQFHQQSNLDLVEDELKTIICSYPIRPRAPLPPDLVSGGSLPERIIEQPTVGEPAKLVYYEPLVLISGLILLALTLLGLTTSAYVFTKRNKGSGRLNASGRSSTVSSRLYRNPPAQTANLRISPPLIGISQPKESTIRRYGYKPTKLDGATSKTIKGDAQPDSISSLKHSNRLISTVSINPAGQSGSSADSLADRNDRVSVTTIEIPFLGKAKSSSDDESNLRASEDANEATNNELALVPANKSHETAEQDRELEVGRVNEGFVQDQGEEDEAIEKEKPKRRSKGEPRVKSEGKESKEVQVGGIPEPFGSLRPTLTSPEEFRRLQEVARLFDEILIENHVDRGDDRTIVYNTTRLSPSKYKTKILDSMDEDERRLMSHLLQDDEVFRSLVVESTNSETFRQKLRENPAYCAQFKPEAWDLVEEILLDTDISSDYAYSSNTVPTEHSTKRFRSGSRASKSHEGVSGGFDLSPTNTEKPHRKKSRQKKEKVGRDESVLSERDAHVSNSAVQQSETEIQWPTPGSGDSLESSESRVYFVMYERHLFVT